MPDVVPTEIDVSFAPKQARCVYTVEIDGEAVLLDESVNRLHLLNSTATLLWRLFDGEASIGELARELSEELPAPYEAVLNDTLDVVRDLGAEGLLDGVAPTHDRDPAAMLDE